MFYHNSPICITELVPTSASTHTSWKNYPWVRLALSIPTLKLVPFVDRSRMSEDDCVQLWDWFSAELPKALRAEMNTHRGSSRHLQLHGFHYFQIIYSPMYPIFNFRSAWGLVIYTGTDTRTFFILALVLYKFCSAFLLNKKSKLIPVQDFFANQIGFICSRVPSPAQFTLIVPLSFSHMSQLSLLQKISKVNKGLWSTNGCL